jgi:hypothetical protein
MSSTSCKALDIALEHDKPSAALRAYYNLADETVQLDRAQESAEFARDGLALARRVGNRYWEWALLGFAYPLFALGDWDEVLAREDGLPEEDWAQARIAFAALLTAIVPVRVHEALRSAELSLETRHAMGISFEAVKESFVVAVEAALALDDGARAEELLAVVDTLPPGGSPQFLQAHSARFSARLAARRADPEEADRLFKRAGGLFRELAFPFYLAVTLARAGRVAHGT